MGTFEERQEKENKKCYQKWLSCGFKGEMKVDESGWFRSGFCLKGEEIEVFNKGYTNKASISFMELPNKKWISGSSAFCRTHGHGFGLSIWNQQHDTKEEAIEEALNRIEKEIDKKDKKTLIKKVEEIRNRFKKDTLQLLKTIEHFEQIDLF